MRRLKNSKYSGNKQHRRLFSLNATSRSNHTEVSIYHNGDTDDVEDDQSGDDEDGDDEDGDDENGDDQNGDDENGDDDGGDDENGGDDQAERGDDNEGV